MKEKEQSAVTHEKLQPFGPQLLLEALGSRTVSNGLRLSVRGFAGVYEVAQFL
jgi:hypothetical protein